MKKWQKIIEIRRGPLNFVTDNEVTFQFFRFAFTDTLAANCRGPR